MAQTYSPGAGLARLTDGGVSMPPVLIGGEFPRVGRRVPIAAGQTLVTGSVLGKVTATGAYVLSDAGAEDGSEAPTVILVEGVDTTGGVGDGLVYFTGEFNEAALVLGDGHTVDGIRDALRAWSIFLTHVPG